MTSQPSCFLEPEEELYMRAIARCQQSSLHLSSSSNTQPEPIDSRGQQTLSNNSWHKEQIMTSQGNFPLGGKEVSKDRATATCYCGAVQLEFPTEGDDLVDTFICNCTDCRKFTATMFASNFIVNDSALKHLKGQDKLTKYAQSSTIETGNTMENHFCSVCGTLMYRVSSGFPGKSIMRIGTVDDYSLHDTKLKPRIEQFVKDRVSWLSGGQGVQQENGNFYKG